MTTEQKLRDALEILEQMNEAPCQPEIRGQIAMARTRLSDALSQPEQQASEAGLMATRADEEMRRADHYKERALAAEKKLAEQQAPQADDLSHGLYIGGPYPDGTYSICATATGRVLQKIDADDLPKLAAPGVEKTLSAFVRSGDAERAAIGTRVAHAAAEMQRELLAAQPTPQAEPSGERAELLPELMKLADAYAQAFNQFGSSTYNPRTKAEREFLENNLRATLLSAEPKAGAEPVLWTDGYSLARLAEASGSFSLPVCKRSGDVPLYTHPPAAQKPLTDAARDVLVERERQITAEGWTPQHDNDHGHGELALAASCYACVSSTKLNGVPSLYEGKVPPPNWPWGSKWWKPGDPRRMLIKAGALILAEIERADRAHGITGKEQQG